MMTSNQLPQLKIYLYKGDDETAIIEVIDERGKRAEFHGYQVDADCYDMATGDFIWRLSTTTGEIETKTGEILLNIPHKLTENATWEQAAFDLQLTDPDGKIKTIAQGTMTLESDITQTYGE